MAETATQRIARELAARKNAAPVEDEAPAAENDEAPAADEDETEAEAPAKPLTMKEKQALKKKQAAAQPVEEDEEADDEDEEDETSDSESSSGTQTSSKSAGTGKGSTKSRPSSSSKGKKPASPPQIAAREKFAAASRARAAERAGTAPASSSTTAAKKTTGAAKAPKAGPKVTTPIKQVVSKGRQTPEQVKAAQNETRKAAREAAAASAAPRRNTATSKAKTVKETAAAKKARLKRETAEAAPKLIVIKGGKQGPKAQSSRTTTPREAGETRTKVHALLAKGKTRREIMDALDLSYPSVLYHARSYEGAVASTRGSVFVKTNLDEEGNKLGKGKTEEVSRSEAMRRDFKSGMKVGDVARKHEVRYQIAYTAIRPLILAEEE